MEIKPYDLRLDQSGSESRMTSGDEEFEIDDRVAPKEGEKVFVKTINSSFGNKDYRADCLFGKDTRAEKDATEMITRRISERLSVQPEDIFIVFNEPPLKNWGMGGKQKESRGD